MVDGRRLRTVGVADGLGLQLQQRWTAISLVIVVDDDVVVVLDAVWRCDCFFLDALGEVVGKAAAALLEAVVPTPRYAVVFKAVENERIKPSSENKSSVKRA